MAFFSFIPLSLKKRLDGADCFRHQTSCSRSVKAVALGAASNVESFLMHSQEEREKKEKTVPPWRPPSSPASNLLCFSLPQSTDAHWDVRALPPPSPQPPTPFFPPFAFLSPFSLSLTCEWQPIRGRVASASASVTSTARSDALLEKEGGGGRERERRERRGRRTRRKETRERERERRDDRKKV